MNNSPSSDRDEQATDPEVKSSQSPQETSFWLRDLPYAVVFVLALFGIAYNSYSKQSIVGYWEFLALAICMVCIGSGWPHAHDKKTRLRLVWTQVLHWLAFLIAMNVMLLPSVQRMMNANATSLAILTLLALGTFTAGVHILSWQICLLGIVMALGVPASAWLEQSALLLGLGVGSCWNWLGVVVLHTPQRRVSSTRAAGAAPTRNPIAILDLRGRESEPSENSRNDAGNPAHPKWN